MTHFQERYSERYGEEATPELIKEILKQLNEGCSLQIVNKKRRRRKHIQSHIITLNNKNIAVVWNCKMNFLITALPLRCTRVKIVDSYESDSMDMEEERGERDKGKNRKRKRTNKKFRQMSYKM